MAGYGNVKGTVSTADAVLKVGAGYIHWITIHNNHATEVMAVQLEDTGTDVWSILLEALDVAPNASPFHAVFDPPIRCETGIFLDIQNGTALVSVGVS